nr:lutropin-choriogonadotropic hormone receptor-like [Onthophagus taurus]
MSLFVSTVLILSVPFVRSSEFSSPNPRDGGDPRKNCVCDGGLLEIDEVECRCSGQDLVDIPATLSSPSTLVLENAGIEVLKRTSLLPFAKTIEKLTMINLDRFYYFEPGVFDNLVELHQIYIQGAPKLLKIQPEVFSAFLPKLYFLKIVQTGLEEMPNLNNLNTTSVLHSIDLEHNHIKRIGSHQISKIRTGLLFLNYNDLEAVDEEAFFGSQIAELSLKGNVELRHLHRRAFAGLQSLRVIDLSSTAITFLPVEGLRDIEVLKMQDTKSLTVFPSIYNFPSIMKASLTYPYHCCAFKHPDTHNPSEFEIHQRFQEMCEGKNSTTMVYSEFLDAEFAAFKSGEFLATSNITSNIYDSSSRYDRGDNDEYFHNPILTTNGNSTVTFADCGNLHKSYHEVKCDPVPDAFSPCEDLMGNWVLRISVWFISLSAVIGNLFVVVVIATSHFRLTVSKFLMCNLAIADLCIGIHLFLIAIEDACSIKVYFNYAINWQEGNGCNVAGFLTIFGNILSVYTLAIITIERWYTITWAIQLNRRLKLRTAVRVMIAGWICALTMATFPLIGISSYAKTSICLPLENKGKTDAIYLSTLLAFNAITFVLVCVCYGSMYRSIKEGGSHCSLTYVRCDLTVAKKMALLVFTDFACWAPIAFFGMTALMGYPLITVTQTKILLVFFYPLNSCANPCLYALLTQQYRRDFFILMGRYGLCKDRAERHKGAIGGKPLPYGSVPQYKRTSGDTMKVNCRSSPLTTVVSVEMPMTRNNSNIRSKHESLDTVPEYPMCTMNNHYGDCKQSELKKQMSTENL